jgi:hypothetical protein
MTRRRADFDPNFMAALDAAKADLQKLFATVQEFARAVEKNIPLTNFLQGLNSPDPEQRKRFDAAAVAAQDLTLEGVKPYLEVFERAKQRRGRKKGSAISSDMVVLERMRALVKKGVSVPEAARQFAEEAARHGCAKPESTVKRLVSKYRSKYGR